MLIISVKYCCSPCYNCKLWFTLQSGPPRVDCVASHHVIDPPWTSLAGIRPDTICSSLAAAVQPYCIRWCLDGVGLVLFSPPGVSLCVWLLHAGFHHVVPLLTCLATTGSLEWRGEIYIEEILKIIIITMACQCLIHSTVKPPCPAKNINKIRYKFVQ